MTYNRKIIEVADLFKPALIEKVIELGVEVYYKHYPNGSHWVFNK